MAPARIIVVPKPLEQFPPQLDDSADDPESIAIKRRLALARGEHVATLEYVRALTATMPCVSWLETPSAEALAGAALVVTVGGDGTFLTVARHCRATPLFGVNSSPSTSTGHYCIALPSTLEALLALWREGRLKTTPLARIRAEIEGQRLPHDALNDLLFANRTPVSSTRFALRIGDVTELHLSSGMWIATASGSTAAIRSAGGEVRPMHDHRLQWRVREPYLRDGETRTLLSGFTDDAIEIVSRSDKNALYVDGHGEPFAVPRGARARLYRSPDLLFAYLDAPTDLTKPVKHAEGD